jgi:predicted MFS family arabinose efflux permease
VVPARGRRGPSLTADARRILTVQALRAFAYGLGSVLVGISLERQGLSGTEVGLVLAALLAGSALATLALARYGDVVGRRRAYLVLFAVMGVAGTVFALTGSVPALVLAALTGTVSTDVVESGPFASLEQAMLPGTAAGDPTRLFGSYTTVATLAGSLGALAAAAPAITGTAPQRWLLVYPAVAALGIVVASGLSTSVEAIRETERAPRRPLERSHPIVVRLSALFALDSFAGGFVVQAFIAYWFAAKFGTSTETLAVVFFAIGILQALSFQAAVRIAGRFGLLRTMVFTHLPSNVLLAAVPFAPTQGLAIALLLARFALSQMDVPTRQAYVVAVVEPAERTATAAYTNSARTAVRPVAPLLMGPLLNVALGAPFVVAGVLKSAYDLALYRTFRHVDPEVDDEE